jgi:DNA-binding LacI/PurR family transcriptional regulator
MGKKQSKANGTVRVPRKTMNLKKLAEHLDLSPATVSLVINRSSVADSIPQETKDRVFAAARKFKYRPNFLARSLRAQRSFTIGVIVPEVSEGYSAAVMSGVEDYLLQEGYFYLVASHRHRADLIDEYPRMFLERSVDGIIAVDTPWRLNLAVPIVTVSGHQDVKGVTNIVLNHLRAAEVALKHLVHLGHHHIAFMKGQEFSSDTSVRWNTIEFALNDISAMGAIRALRQIGWQVPEDISVVGFDDIQSAAYQPKPNHGSPVAARDGPSGSRSPIETN